MNLIFYTLSKLGNPLCDRLAASTCTDISITSMHACACMYIDNTWRSRSSNERQLHEGWLHEGKMPSKNSTDLLDKANHLMAFCAWDRCSHLPVNLTQLMRSGFGQNTSLCTFGDLQFELHECNMWATCKNYAAITVMHHPSWLVEGGV